MDNLIAFIKARLEEDEAAAKKAVPGPWRWADWTAMFGTLEQERNTLEHSPGSPPFPAVAERDRETTRVLRLEDPLEIDPDQEASAEHIARHDPARVLREVEAKRAIVAAHQPGSSGGPCSVCIADRRSWQDDWCPDPWPCETVRKLVSIWSDHPAYRAEWAP